jgi:hypothetical protein
MRVIGFNSLLVKCFDDAIILIFYKAHSKPSYLIWFRMCAVCYYN